MNRQHSFKTNMMQTKAKTRLTTWDDHMDTKYGKPGPPAREDWEQEFKAFKSGVLLGEARVKLKMTQEELAKKCGTSKANISRIENDASDTRLSTLMRIIQHWLGGHLKLTIKA